MTTENELDKIFHFLELDHIDGRLKLKADTMKRIIELAQIWQKGSKQAWIDKLANRTCLSTRRIRENYIEPLITEGIFQETGSMLSFKGLPNGAEVQTEQLEEQLHEDYLEYVEKKKEAELYLEYKEQKPKMPFEKWLEQKAEQEGFKPQQDKKPVWQQWLIKEAEKTPEISFETWKHVKKPNEV